MTHPNTIGLRVYRRGDAADSLDAFLRHSGRELVKSAAVLEAVTKLAEKQEEELLELRQFRDLTKVALYAVQRGFIAPDNVQEYVEHHAQQGTSPSALQQQMRERGAGDTFRMQKASQAQDPTPQEAEGSARKLSSSAEATIRAIMDR